MKTDYQSRVKVIGPQTRVQVIPSLADRLTSTNEMPLKRVCAYCRVSTAQEEQQSSYDLQVSHYTDYIKRNDLWEFSGIYADEGISGTSIKKRSDFLRMIADCKAGKIDLIVTKSISRFARNTLDCLNYVRMLKALPSPVGIYFEKENIDTLDAKSELLLTLLSSLAQDESRSISENVRWSIQKRYQQGLVHCPTTFFLGYDSDENGNLIINEEQAQTVRRIYRECLEGYGTGLIAKRLTADGVKTGKGNTIWVGNSVYRILHNEKYCGDILMQKRVTLDFLTHKRIPNKGHQPQYFIANHHPAIVSKADWDAVQIEVNRRSKMNNANENKMPQKHSNRTVFSNFIYCGTCGDPFTRKSCTSTKNNKKYLYPVWKCRVADGRRKGRECHARSYREEVLEHSFMAMLLEMKLGQKELIKETELAIAQDDLDAWEKERMDYLETEIESLKERLSQVAVSSRKSAARDVYDDLSIDLSREIEVLQNEMERLNEKKHEALVKKGILKWLIEELNNLNSFNPFRESVDFREDIFRRIVTRGDVFDDGSIIYELKIGVTRKAKGDYTSTRKLWALENAKI